MRALASSTLVGALLAGGVLLGACDARVGGTSTPAAPAVRATPLVYSGDPEVTRQGTRAARLVARAAFAYEDAVVGTELVSPESYQRAVDLLGAARSAYQRIAGDVAGVSEHSAAAISSGLGQLGAVLPAQMPGEPIATPSDVTAEAAAVARRLERAVAADFPGAADPVPVIEEMGATLADLSIAYRKGDHDVALAALGGLREQYRALSLEVAALSPDVNARVTEHLANLGMRMEQGASDDEVSDMVRGLSELLAAAVSGVEEAELVAQG